MKPDRNAIVTVTQADTLNVRPALFVFSTPDGFAWVEPAYLEPGAPRQAFIRVAGSLTLHATGFTLAGADGRQYAVVPLDALQAGEWDDCKGVIAWATAELAAQGVTLDQERERLRVELGDQLA